MTPWNWSVGRPSGILDNGIRWLRPFVTVVPWITVVLLFELMFRVGDAFTLAKGVVFDLPSAENALEGAVTPMVALVMPDPKESKTLVFFDDARYTLGDWSSESYLEKELARRTDGAAEKTLLVLADRRVPGGDILRFAELAKETGVRRILFSEKSSGKGGE